MPGTSSEEKVEVKSQPKRRPWFFISIIGGIIIGAFFDNVGAGVAIGIGLWPILELIDKKRHPADQDSQGEVSSKE